MIRSIAVALLFLALASQTAGNLLPFVKDVPFADTSAPRDHATPWLVEAEATGFWFDHEFDGRPSVDAVRGAALVLATAAALHALALGMAAGRRSDWALGVCLPATVLLAGGLLLADWGLPRAAHLSEPARSAGFGFLVAGLICSGAASLLLVPGARRPA